MAFAVVPIWSSQAPKLSLRMGGGGVFVNDEVGGKIAAKAGVRGCRDNQVDIGISGHGAGPFDVKHGFNLVAIHIYPRIGAVYSDLRERSQAARRQI